MSFVETTFVCLRWCFSNDTQVKVECLRDSLYLEQNVSHVLLLISRRLFANWRIEDVQLISILFLFYSKMDIMVILDRRKGIGLVATNWLLVLFTYVLLPLFKYGLLSLFMSAVVLEGRLLLRIVYLWILFRPIEHYLWPPRALFDIYTA